MEVLKRLYTEDELTVEELEERLDRCYRAGSLEELESLFADLPARPEPGEVGGGRSPAGSPTGTPGAASSRPSGDPSGEDTRSPRGPAGGPAREGTAPARGGRGGAPAERDRHDLVLAVMSGVERSGSWTPPRHTNVLAVMGGAELDFRRARFPPGVTSVHAVAVMGAVHVVVPPGLRVESAGVPLMGGFDRVDQDGDGESFPDAVLRIRGVACMGGVEVEVKAPEEQGGRPRGSRGGPPGPGA